MGASLRFLPRNSSENRFVGRLFGLRASRRRRAPVALHLRAAGLAAVEGVVNDAVDDGDQVPRDADDQTTARQLIGAQTNLLVLRRCELPAKRFQIGADCLLATTMIRVESTHSALPPIPFGVSVVRRRRVGLPQAMQGQRVVDLVVVLAGRDGDSAGGAIARTLLAAGGACYLGAAPAAIILDKAAGAVPSFRWGSNHANGREDALEDDRTLVRVHFLERGGDDRDCCLEIRLRVAASSPLDRLLATFVADFFRPGLFFTVQ